MEDYVSNNEDAPRPLISNRSRKSNCTSRGRRMLNSPVSCDMTKETVEPFASDSSDDAFPSPILCDRQYILGKRTSGDVKVAEGFDRYHERSTTLPCLEST